MIKRVELLAPCGNYESFLAAVNAGADAVYLGGRQFGARAYAENFSEEELIKAVRQAHFFGVKVYLTVNTLVKEREFSGLFDYILPLYEAGLDGAIVQDMGVLCFLHRNFPDLKLHASTQMTITGAYGAAYLKELGCERIVPARELSLAEIKEMRRQVPVEIEAFIHGAMCYCYSGQCLMSSMIGGRSGNRGRCAGPCRLPYRVKGKEGYYLSLKDMNTLEHIPELIEAGIDSFKIEGRMKKPEYVAGVVSVYRKYIDKYYAEANGSGMEEDMQAASASPHTLSIEEKDRKLLSDLYIRSETGNGYYEKRNGKDMLTLSKPGYNEADPALLAKLRERYVHELPKIGIRFFARCRAGEKLYGEVRFLYKNTQGKSSTERYLGEEASFIDRDTTGEVRLSVTGDAVEQAKKRAVSAEEIRGQLVKTGETPFVVEECVVEAEEGIFVPIARVNALRRALLQKIYAYYGTRDLQGMEKLKCRAESMSMLSGQGATGGSEIDKAKIVAADLDPKEGIGRKGKTEKEQKYTFTVIVQTREQFEAIFSAIAEEERRKAKSVPNRETELFETGARGVESIWEYLVADADLLLEDRGIAEKLSAGKVRWGIKCPVILRKSDEKFLQNLRTLIEERKPDIIYCATIDALAWLKSISYTGKIAGEASLYAWNAEAVSFWSGELDRISIPWELSSREIRELCVSVQDIDRDSQETRGSRKSDKALMSRLEAPIYGRTPFMVSANCVKLSAGNCDKNRKKYAELTDRLGNIFPVYTNCSHCYNMIYNRLPTSYEEDLWMLLEDKIKAFRVEFTTESGREAAQVMQTFRRLFASERKRDWKKEKAAGVETTKGRFRLGVE